MERKRQKSGVGGWVVGETSPPPPPPPQSLFHLNLLSIPGGAGHRAQSQTPFVACGLVTSRLPFSWHCSFTSQLLPNAATRLLIAGTLQSRTTKATRGIWPRQVLRSEVQVCATRVYRVKITGALARAALAQMHVVFSASRDQYSRLSGLKLSRLLNVFLNQFP